MVAKGKILLRAQRTKSWLSRYNLTTSLKVHLSIVLLCLIQVVAGCTWSLRPNLVPPIDIKIFAGASQTALINNIQKSAELRKVRLEIFRQEQRHSYPEPAQKYFSVEAKPLTSSSVMVRVKADSKTPPGNYGGQIILQLRPDEAKLISLVNIKVESLENSNSGIQIIPARPTSPTPDRIVEDAHHQRMVVDELEVVLALDTPADQIIGAGSICGSGGSCVVCPSPPDIKPDFSTSSTKLAKVDLRKLWLDWLRKLRDPKPGSDPDSPASIPLSELIQDWGGSICAIAYLSGGEFLGSVPEAKVYQLRYPNIGSIDELLAKRKEVLQLSALFPEMIAVSRSFVGTSLPAFAQPRDYDGPAGIPGGNAAAFNTINVLDAWDKATTASDRIPGNPPPPVGTSAPPRIAVAVIDADFVGIDNHEELRGGGFDNIGYISETAGATPIHHGSEVAGIIGARGNNGSSATGIAGMIWDVDLRLYDFDRNQTLDATEIQMLEAMVRAIDNKTLCDSCSSASHPLADNVDIPGATRYPQVINVSQDLVRFTPCPAAGATNDPAAESNAVLGQGILYGVRQNKEILWVFAAGNGNKEASCESPAGLTRTFPLNTISVAATNPTGNLLWPGSNFGNSVTIAAPGENLRTLFTGPSEYAAKSGTSVAAPIVTGLAALILSEKPDYTARKVKQCIVQNAREVTLSGHTFRFVNAAAAMPTATEPGGNCPVPMPTAFNNINKLDVVLSFDTTGSMSQEISAVRTKAVEIMTEIKNAMGETGIVCPSGECCAAADVCFSVVSYEDFSGQFDSSSSTACNSSYNQTYGASSDRPFRVVQKLSEDTTAVQSAINTLTTLSGADGPEAYGTAFSTIAKAVSDANATGDPNIGFLSETNRPSMKIIINFGDSVPHDTNLNGSNLPCQNITVECASPCDRADKLCNQRAGLRLQNPPVINPNDTGVDPGPNAVIDNCGGDDVDFQNDALMGLINQKIRLIHIDSSEKADLIPYWSVWTQATGGALAPIKTDGTSIEDPTIDLPSLVREVLGSIPAN